MDGANVNHTRSKMVGADGLEIMRGIGPDGLERESQEWAPLSVLSVQGYFQLGRRPTSSLLKNVIFLQYVVAI